MDEVIHLNSYSLKEWEKYGLINKGRIIFNTTLSKAGSPTNNNFSVLIIGSITEVKGYDLIMNQIEKLENANFRIGIIGKADGLFAKSFLDKISSNDFIEYIGLVDNPEDFIASARVIWCLSKGEGQSLAMLEALEQGKVILSTNYPSVEDLIIDGENGFIIESNDIEEFVEKTNGLLSDNDMYVQMSVNSINIFNKKFSYKVFLDNIKKLINDVTTNS
jgi:glycosyltransferase involved in cell wall biosynthesis